MSLYPRAPRSDGSEATEALAADPSPGSDEALALSAVETLTGLATALRQGIADRLWSEIPTRVEEEMFNPGAGIGPAPAVIVQPRFASLVRIDRVIYSVPPGASATIRLGNDFILPNVTGQGSLGVAKMLNANSVRTLTLDTAPTAGTGGAFLGLHGQQLAPEGQISL